MECYTTPLTKYLPSIIIYMQATQTAGTNVVNMRFNGYDAYGGDTAQEFLLLKETIVAGKTFV